MLDDIAVVVVVQPEVTSVSSLLSDGASQGRALGNALALSNLGSDDKGTVGCERSVSRSDGSQTVSRPEVKGRHGISSAHVRGR